MNQTEAWEEVIAASEAMVKHSEQSGMIEPDCITTLRKALVKVKPRVERMRSRLDHARARRAGKPRCPKGLEP